VGLRISILRINSQTFWERCSGQEKTPLVILTYNSFSELALKGKAPHSKVNSKIPNDHISARNPS